MPQPPGYQALCDKLCCNKPPEPYEGRRKRLNDLRKEGPPAQNEEDKKRYKKDLCSAYNSVGRIEQAATQAVRWFAGDTDEDGAKLLKAIAPPCEVCSGPDVPNEREKALRQKLGGWYEKLDPRNSADRVMRRNLVQVACSSYTKEALRDYGDWAISNRVYTQAHQHVRDCAKSEKDERIVLFLLKDEDVGGVAELLEEIWQGRLKAEWRKHCQPESGVRGRKGSLIVRGLLSEVALKIKKTVDAATRREGRGGMERPGDSGRKGARRQPRQNRARTDGANAETHLP